MCSILASHRTSVNEVLNPPEILHHHIAKAFFRAAGNKISKHDTSASGVNRMRELLGESPIPPIGEFSFI